MDTAAMLVCRDALGLILTEIDGISAACARLADTFIETPMMPGRTLLQQALPTTFGLKAAGWLVSMLEVGEKLARSARVGARRAVGWGGGDAGLARSCGHASPRRVCAGVDLAEPSSVAHGSGQDLGRRGRPLGRRRRAGQDLTGRHPDGPDGGRRSRRARRRGKGRLFDATP